MLKIKKMLKNEIIECGTSKQCKTFNKHSLDDIILKMLIAPTTMILKKKKKSFFILCFNHLYIQWVKYEMIK
jgi:hypothetical protein